MAAALKRPTVTPPADPAFVAEIGAAPAVLSWDEFEAAATAQGKTVQYEDYTDYRSRMTVRAEFEAREARESQARAEAAGRTAAEARVTHWQATLTAARAAHADFDAKMQQATEAGLVLDPHIGATLMTMPKADAAVLVYMADHPETFDTLNQCETPFEVALEVGRMRQAMAASAAPPAPTTPAAPQVVPPVAPLRGGTGGTGPKSLDDLSARHDGSEEASDAWIERRQQDLREQRTRRKAG